MRNSKACVSDPNDFETCPGEQFHIEFSAKVMPDGRIELVPSGKTDIKQMINSFRDSTDMSFILSRLAAGDTSVLSQKEPMFGDFTELPKTYAESLQLVIDSKKKFYELPLDVRNKFDNDYQKWFVSAGSDSWLKAMGYDPVIKPAEEEQVSQDAFEKESVE